MSLTRVLNGTVATQTISSSACVCRVCVLTFVSNLFVNARSAERQARRTSTCSFGLPFLFKNQSSTLRPCATMVLFVAFFFVFWSRTGALCVAVLFCSGAFIATWWLLLGRFVHVPPGRISGIFLGGISLEGHFEEVRTRTYKDTLCRVPCSPVQKSHQ